MTTPEQAACAAAALGLALIGLTIALGPRQGDARINRTNDDLTGDASDA